MFVCSACGKIYKNSKEYPHNMCQGCYTYFRKGGGINPLPAPGTIAYDYRGYVVCHICGRAYVRLGSHIKESHNMTIKEYKEKFELCSSSHTTERTYSETMSTYAIENGMGKHLFEVGRNTRIRKGETDKREGKKVRLQEIIEKRNRHKKEENT